MSTQPAATLTGEPREPARPALISKGRKSRRLWADRLARRVVTLGGVAIIASILAIFFVIAAEVYPLFRLPKASSIATDIALDSETPLAVGADEYRELVYIVTESGVQLFSLKSGRPVDTNVVVPLGGTRVVGCSAVSRGSFALGLADGRVIPIEVRFNVSYGKDQRVVESELMVSEPIVVAAPTQPIEALAHVVTDTGAITAAAVGEKELSVVAVRERRSLIGDANREELRQQIVLPAEGRITSLLLDGRGEDLFAGTSSGQVVRVDLLDPSAPQVGRPVIATSQPLAAVTAMGFLIGDRTLAVGDEGGGVSTWQVLINEQGERVLNKIYDFPALRSRVLSFAASPRDKGFLASDASGQVRLYYGTTGVELLTLQANARAMRALSITPKADGIVAVDDAGELAHWSLTNPHPEISLRALFGKVWYEGYSEPEHVWQSTGGTDDFEAKLSLTPLVFGTLKGTVYALMFAVPMALLGALYASQFMHPDLKRFVKPTVEIMAALPSVVLGFVAGLWLAPMMEKVVPGIFLMPLVVPTLILLALGLWQIAPLKLRGRFRAGTEVFLLIPVVIAGTALAFYFGRVMESSVLGGDYRDWLLSALGLAFDQRNSLVVGFAMGFAVIPIIFTIAEDSLTNVPQHLAAASLALGATRWQTAVRVILPTASPGIFSAIMIGFGRAVGETMIVLMATGNTPVMEWSIFNGFRALSANVAVELPEAPEGGTLYRVLFLAALLLFVMTFIVNTAAEVVRLRLRKKYRYL